MKLYSIDVQIVGTLYIRANNLEEARNLLRVVSWSHLEEL